LDLFLEKEEGLRQPRREWGGFVRLCRRNKNEDRKEAEDGEGEKEVGENAKVKKKEKA